MVCGFANRLRDWSLKDNNENLRTSKHIPGSILGSRATKALEEAGAEVCSWLPACTGSYFKLSSEQQCQHEEWPLLCAVRRAGDPLGCWKRCGNGSLRLGQVLVRYHGCCHPRACILCCVLGSRHQPFAAWSSQGWMWPAAPFLDKNHGKASSLLLWKKGRGVPLEGRASCRWPRASSSSPAGGCKCLVLGWSSAVPMWPRFLYPGEVS